MTSALRKFSQIDTRTKFLRMNATIVAWTVKDGFKAHSIMDVEEFTDAFNFANKTITFTNTNNTTTLMDLGRQITVYDAAVVGAPHVAVFREVLHRDGTQFYICVNILKYDEDYGFAVADVSRIG